MFCFPRRFYALWCALAVLATSAVASGGARADTDMTSGKPVQYATEWAERTVLDGDQHVVLHPQVSVNELSAGQAMAPPEKAASPGEVPQPDSIAPPDAEPWDEPFDNPRLNIAVLDPEVLDSWTWQWLPVGLIYHSYLAGVHEPRMALVAFNESSGRALWDATLGGRVGVLRFGDCDPVHPQGFQLDFYGAAVARLDVEQQQDLDSTDYVFGLPITYGVDRWQFKFGYAHISSHLGDELALRDPSTLANRVNYVRDSLVYGFSYYPTPLWRQYAEVGWAFHNSGGAQPWEAQFGSELALPGPTGLSATPYIAVNGRMREEHDFGGDVAVQIGWLRRGLLGQTLRLGVHYYNGKSSQFQFFDSSEEQIGIGLWYDM